MIVDYRLPKLFVRSMLQNMPFFFLIGFIDPIVYEMFTLGRKITKITLQNCT